MLEAESDEVLSLQPKLKLQQLLPEFEFVNLVLSLLRWVNALALEVLAQTALRPFASFVLLVEGAPPVVPLVPMPLVVPVVPVVFVPPVGIEGVLSGRDVEAVLFVKIPFSVWLAPPVPRDRLHRVANTVALFGDMCPSELFRLVLFGALVPLVLPGCGGIVGWLPLSFPKRPLVTKKLL